MDRPGYEQLARVEAKLDLLTGPGGSSVNWYERVEQKLDAITLKLEALVALVDDLKQAIKALDDETTLVASNVAQLAARIHNSMTDAEVADVKAALTAEGDRLKTLAVDPTAPVPPPPAPLLAARKKAAAKP